MKVTFKPCAAAFTRMELIVVLLIGVCACVAVVINCLPPLYKARRPAHRLNCVNNLKQVGTAFRLWSGDHGDLYPMQVSTNAGGALESAERGEVCHVFQALSNELTTPKLLLCPSDQRRALGTFGSLSNANLSYFIGLNASETEAASWLTGDHNLMLNGKEVGPGIANPTNGQAIGWTSNRHVDSGNLGLADGSVQQLTSRSLTALLATNTPATTRLAIP
jgi:hypothetical protein